MSGKSCRILMVVIAVLSLAGLAACGKSDSGAIQDTIVEFYDAYVIEDFASCLEMFSTRLRTDEGEANLTNRMKFIRTATVPILINEMGKPLVDELTATIWVTFFHHGDRHSRFSMPLLKKAISGSWMRNCLAPRWSPYSLQCKIAMMLVAVQEKDILNLTLQSVKPWPGNSL